jgi:hypothetical protein
MAMIQWLLDWVRRRVGHWLLSDEEAYERRRDEERSRKQREIIDAGETVDDCVDDLDSGRF